jgi:branched-chain amino acid transport system ATP-binding protein
MRARHEAFVSGAPDRQPLLRTRDLTRRFGGLTAVAQLTLSLWPGETVALIGPNGAGKTTAFNLLSGLTPPTEGEIWFRGVNVTRVPAFQIARMGMARTFQITSIIQGLNVRDNVVLAAQGPLKTSPSPFGPVRNWRDVEVRAERALALAHLEPLVRRRVGALSHGDQRRVEIAMALAASPCLLLLDEPTQGMSVSETWATVDLLKGLRAALPELTILIVEHDVPVVMDLADRILVLHLGRLIANGTPDEVAGDPEVQTAYLGTRRAHA